MNDYIRLAAAVPRTRPCDVAANAASTAAMMDDAARSGASLVVFPRLSLTGATCGDLLRRPALIDAAESALADLAARSAAHPGTAFVVGLPVRVGDAVVPASAVLSGGAVRGVATEAAVQVSAVSLLGADVPVGADLVFSDATGSLAFAVGASGGARARIVAVPFAEAETVGAADRRRALFASCSSASRAAFVAVGAGDGESTTHGAYSGHALVAEDGEIVAEGPLFARGGALTVADVDAGYLRFARSRGGPSAPSRTVPLGFAATPPAPPLRRPVDAHPFVPADPAARERRCAEVLAIQSAALAGRLEAISCRDVVIGLSGGLDSALALLVCVEAFARLGLDAKGIHVLTLPGFGTTHRTKGNAELLGEGLGLAVETVDIAESVRRHFADIGHDESVRDVTYENAQARMRTLVLMDRANQVGGIVVGTGDLSELALGWCTFNGDHMSMYGVNAGVPKTLIRHVVDWYARSRAGAESPAGRALLDILATPVSPELLPANSDGTIAQETEDRVGPYELHDFFLWHFMRRGASKEKIRLLAEAAFAGTYDAATVSRWLDVFFRRFAAQQFKRNCAPDGPRIGSVSLSPADWRMPSDAVLGE